LWRREQSTVTLNAGAVRKDLRDPYEPTVLMPVADITGHRAAIQMPLCSLEEGKYYKDYKKFITIQKL
jgi:hypothetical protein